MPTPTLPIQLSTPNHAPANLRPPTSLLTAASTWSTPLGQPSGRTCRIILTPTSGCWCMTSHPQVSHKSFQCSSLPCLVNLPCQLSTQYSAPAHASPPLLSSSPSQFVYYTISVCCAPSTLQSVPLTPCLPALLSLIAPRCHPSLNLPSLQIWCRICPHLPPPAALIRCPTIAPLPPPADLAQDLLFVQVVSPSLCHCPLSHLLSSSHPSRFSHLSQTWCKTCSQFSLCLALCPEATSRWVAVIYIFCCNGRV